MRAKKGVVQYTRDKESKEGRAMESVGELADAEDDALSEEGDVDSEDGEEDESHSDQAWLELGPLGEVVEVEPGLLEAEARAEEGDSADEEGDGSDEVSVVVDVAGVACDECRESGVGVCVAAVTAAGVTSVRRHSVRHRGDLLHREDDHLEQCLGDGEGGHQHRRRTPDVRKERPLVRKLVPCERVLVGVMAEDGPQQPVQPVCTHLCVCVSCNVPFLPPSNPL